MFPSFYGWIIFCSICMHGFPGDSDSRESAYRCRRRKFDAWFGKIRWRRKWQPTPVFLSGELHGQRRLVGYSPWGREESDTTEWLRHIYMYTHTHTHIFLIPFSVPGHWGFFLVSATVKRAAMNIGLHVSLPIRVFCRHVPRSRLAGSLFFF